MLFNPKIRNPIEELSVEENNNELSRIDKSLLGSFNVLYADEEGWLENRKQKITATMITVIMGYGYSQDLHLLWKELTGKLNESELLAFKSKNINDTTLRGKILESSVALSCLTNSSRFCKTGSNDYLIDDTIPDKDWLEYADSRVKAIIRDEWGNPDFSAMLDSGLIAKPFLAGGTNLYVKDGTKFACTPDFVILSNNGNGTTLAILEIKTTRSFNNKLSKRYLVQVLWNLYVTSTPIGLLTIATNDDKFYTFKIYLSDYQDLLLNEILPKVKSFLECVEKDIAPALQSVGEYKTVGREAQKNMEKAVRDTVKENIQKTNYDNAVKNTTKSEKKNKIVTKVRLSQLPVTARKSLEVTLIEMKNRYIRGTYLQSLESQLDEAILSLAREVSKRKNDPTIKELLVPDFTHLSKTLVLKDGDISKLLQETIVFKEDLRDKRLEVEKLDSKLSYSILLACEELQVGKYVFEDEYSEIASVTISEDGKITARKIYDKLEARHYGDPDPSSIQSVLDLKNSLEDFTNTVKKLIK